MLPLSSSSRNTPGNREMFVLLVGGQGLIYHRRDEPTPRREDDLERGDCFEIDHSLSPAVIQPRHPRTHRQGQDLGGPTPTNALRMPRGMRGRRPFPLASGTLLESLERQTERGDDSTRGEASSLCHPPASPS
ncbi:hypothetical protein NMY22_g18795 [Coprinellus aureogranulatus]|nr:hypothetical protein NMY22_g18795 [Coprinellus aureogranulatus]